MSKNVSNYEISEESISKIIFGGKGYKYIELADLMLWEHKNAGNSRNSQLKELSRHFEWHKQGNRFIIDKKHEIIQNKEDNRNGNSRFSDLIKLLLLNLLNESLNGKLLLTTNRLLEDTKMVNENYKISIHKQIEISKYYEINEDTVEDFFSLTHRSLRGYLSTALKQLENERLISWRKAKYITIETRVPKQDEYGNFLLDGKNNFIVETSIEERLATEKEEDIIRDAERKTMEKMNFKNIGHVFISSRKKQFIDSVKKIIYKSTHIVNYYGIYSISSNKQYISKELDAIKQIEIENELNHKITTFLKESTVTRANQTLKEKERTFGKELPPSHPHPHRAEINYIEDTNKLIDEMISINIKNSF